mgnify:CR=1 FL=1
MLHLQVAILDKEQILPLGKEITAVGILDRNVDGQPVIKSSTRLPYFLYVHKRCTQMGHGYVYFCISRYSYLCLCILLLVSIL